MKNDSHMLAAALRGYAGDVDDAGLFSSPVWLAHIAGKQLARKGVTAPTRCAMSRGYSVKLETGSGMTWLVEFKGDKLLPDDPQRLD